MKTNPNLDERLEGIIEVNEKSQSINVPSILKKILSTGIVIASLVGGFYYGLNKSINYKQRTTTSSQEKEESEKITRKDETIVPETIEGKIEKELRKLDFWVEEEVKTDYLSNNDAGRVSLSICSDKINKLKRDFGISQVAAQYNTKTDSLSISENTIDQNIGSVSHEMCHALFDRTGKKGLIFQKGYKGPSSEEICDFAKMEVESEYFCEFRKSVSDFQNHSEMEIFKKINENYYNLFDDCSKMTSMHMDISMKFIEFLFDRGFEISEYWDSISQDMMNVAENCKTFKNISLDYVTFLKTFQNSNQTCLDVKMIKSDSFKFLKELGMAYSIYEKAYLISKRTFSDEMIKMIQEDIQKNELEIINESDTNVKEYLATELDAKKSIEKEIIANIESMKSKMNADLEIQEHFKFRMLFIDDYLMDPKINSGIYEIMSPDEFMARIIDSLYSLYYGETTMNNFKLNLEILDFLKRFEFNGRLVFSKGIEKYELGLRMIEEGLNPKEVKKSLEYATEFEYKGKKFSWPDTEIDILGKIPINE